MKIGIITIHNSPNYGACLQSFALYKFLEQPRIQQASAKLRNVFVKALLWC